MRGPGENGGAPERGWLLALPTLAVLLVGSWWSLENRILPSPVPADAPAALFASGRAMAQLEAIAREPRPLGSPEHTRVRELIIEELGRLGAEPEIQTTVELRGGPAAARAFTLRNITARIPGSDPTGTVALVAHYDGATNSPAAGDDGVGVVVILEAVRALLEGPPLRNDLLILITDGEELGLLGAEAFADRHRWMDDISVVLNVEMRGGGGPAHMFETGRENGWIVEEMERGDPHPVAHSFSVEIYRRLPNATDFTIFEREGIQGLNFAAIGRPWVYHQSTDTYENVQEATVQHMGSRVLAITRELGRGDLSVVHAPDRVFTSVPVAGLVSHPLPWALPLSIGLFLMWVGVVVLAIRKGSGWVGVLAGVGVGLGAGVAAALLGWAIVALLPLFHPEFRTITAAVYGEGWYLLALAFGTVAITTALLFLARRRFPIAGVGAGALGIPVLGALALGLTAPLAAIALQLPAFAGLLAVGLTALRSRWGLRELPSVPMRIVVVFLGFAALALTVPLIQGIWIAMSFVVAPALAVLMVVALVALLPALDYLGHPNRRWAPLAFASLGVICLGAGILQAGPSESRPVHSTLSWALDRESGEAVWITREDPGFAWAEETVGPFTELRTLEEFLVPGAYRVAAAAAAGVSIPVPAVTLAGPPPAEADSVVELWVRSEAGAEIVSVIAAEGTQVRFTAVDGHRLDAADRATGPAVRITHQGIPAGPALLVEVSFPPGADALSLVIVEEHLRPRELLGAEPFARPPHLMASPFARSDRAFVRTPVVLTLR